MYEKYVEALAKHTASVFNEMTGTDVLGHKVKRDERIGELSPIAHLITYEHLEKKVKGNFVLGFSTQTMTVAVASALAEKMGLASPSELDDLATDLINEFMNTIVGLTISEWDRMDMPARFSPPQTIRSARLKLDDTVSTEAYVVILSLAFSHVIFRVTFSEESRVKGENKRIMVVEDSAVIRNIIAKTLEQFHFEVMQAENGARATKLYKEFKPHLVIMDLVMPEMGGLEAMATIKGDDPGAKFIVLTSTARRDQVLSAKKIGAQAYLIKPFNPDLLIREVNKLFKA